MKEHISGMEKNLKKNHKPLFLLKIKMHFFAFFPLLFTRNGV